MKAILGILLFLFVFGLAGVVMHFALYDEPGVFIWSLDGENRIVQTKLDSGVSEIAALMQSGSKNSREETAEQAAEASAPAPSESAPEPGPAGSDVPADSGEKAGEPEGAAGPPAEPGVIRLFDGKTLGKWEITQFGGEGDVFVTEDGELEFGFGAIMTGVHWKEEPPRLSNFEITLDAMKLDGTDFFCALTFPVKESHATFVIGGWGGGIVGISSVDDLDASENETMNIEGFNEDVWYRIRVRVTDDRIEAWIDDDKMVDLELADRKISLRPGDIELCVPMGIASFQTRAKFRDIVWKNLPLGE